MARATRSSAQQVQEAEKQSSDPPNATPRGKAASKKRKRTSIAENDEQPAAKQSRSADPTIKEEGESHEPEDTVGMGSLLELPNAGDVPIDAGDAQKVLDILETIDTQGLLDRVFPLFSNSGEGPSSQPVSHSLRALLKESAQHPLCVLHSAVQQLFPISSHPRSRPSVPAVQQLNFCHLALSLLDQASFRSMPIPLDIDSIMPQTPLIQDATDDSDTKPITKPKHKSVPRQLDRDPLHAPAFQRKYALMQKLSGGEWWTSLNSNLGTFSADSKALKDISTAHAELVAILPTPSASQSDPKPPIPTLGAYNKKALGPKVKFIGPRRISCGAFLDYGPYASFAPTFEGEGVEVGRVGLGETVWRWGERRKERILERFQRGSIVEVADEKEDIPMVDEQEVNTGDLPPASPAGDTTSSDGVLDGLLPPEEVAVIKAALDTLELEEAVSELLERNRKALIRLEELQRKRLGSDGGGSSEVAEGSEEWDTAQGILNSLTILASIRPRSSHDASNSPPLIPSANALRKLHRTLPAAPNHGWYGALPPTRGSALRDDSTIRIKSGTVVHNSDPGTGAVAPVIPVGATSATPQSTYPYPYRGNYPQQQQQAQQFKAGQTYYSNQGSVQPHTPAQINTQPNAASYYPNQQYGQSQFQYPSPYYYPGQPGTPSGTNSNGRGTPQPVNGGFYNNTVAQPLAQRAVANTVLTAAAAAAASKPPGTPVSANGGHQYGAFQPAPIR